MPELTSQLRPGESYYDRPELQTRLFKDKFDVSESWLSFAEELD